MSQPNPNSLKPVERMPTGIPGLDLVLKGGLLRTGLYIIQGSPGTGKTLMGNQICFHHVRGGGRAAYVALLSESVGRMTHFLQSMKFFDRQYIGDRLQYLSGYHALRQGGLAECLELLRKVIIEHNVTFLVVDGTDALKLASRSDSEFREFLHSMQLFMDLRRCTGCLLTPLNVVYPSPAPGHTIVDGVIELALHNFGPRTTRELEVVKTRGSDFLQGRHEFEITDQGLAIHPRTEVRYVNPSRRLRLDPSHRMKLGVSKLDEMLRGGLLHESATIMIGAPGTGKTSFGMSFLAEGARQGQSGVYFGFHEIPEVLIENCENIKIPVAEAVKRGDIQLVWYQETEHIADFLAERLLDIVRSKNQRPCRLFIDGISGFRRALVYQNRSSQFLAAIMNELRSLGATIIMAEEIDVYTSGREIPMSDLGSISDNMILLRYLESKSELKRLLSIIKTRGTDYESVIHQFTISSKGIEVLDPLPTATEQSLIGQPRAVKVG